MVKKIISFLILFASSNLLAQNASTNQMKILVVTENLPPFQFLDNNNQPSGFAAEVVKELLQRSGKNVAIDFLPWPRAYKIALEKKNVMIFSIARTAKREDKFIWIGKLHQELFGFYAMTNNPPPDINNLHQLKPFLIGVTRASAADIFLSKNGFSNLERTTTISQIVPMLYKQRVDLYFGGDSEFKQAIINSGFNQDNVKNIYKVQEMNLHYFIAMSLTSDKDLVLTMKNQFQELIKDKTISELKLKWGLIERK